MRNTGLPIKRKKCRSSLKNVRRQSPLKKKSCSNFSKLGMPFLHFSLRKPCSSLAHRLSLGLIIKGVKLSQSPSLKLSSSSKMNWKPRPRQKSIPKLQPRRKSSKSWSFRGQRLKSRRSLALSRIPDQVKNSLLASRNRLIPNSQRAANLNTKEEKGIQLAVNRIRLIKGSTSAVSKNLGIRSIRTTIN